MTLFSRTPDVTIGIPAYNAEKYLPTCLQSIADQTADRRRIETIVVDDGSTDGTAEMAERLLKDLRLRGSVVTRPNSGTPAEPRNAVLDQAKGKWTYFVDVDDFLGPEAIESMTELGREGRADVVVGKYVGVNRGVPKVMFRETLSQTDARRTPLIDSLNVLKMYRTEFARDLGYRFNPRLRMAEDHPFALSAYARTERVAVQADVDCYHWVRHKTEAGSQAHLTGHVLPVDDFYAYMFESFAVLARAMDEGLPLAGYLRDRYWHRLLSFDLPTEMRRNRGPEDRDRSIATARRLMLAERVRDSSAELNLKSKAMLRALELGDREMVENVGQLLK
ncbi:glycosyltransferase family 2 protein [Brevibacterium casei]|uniref:Glycosyltransferase involved in cell wall bisynthesis n=1 Tax=Brevibacterium casei CIP 102111 TaxID=1255625 RepID=A0A2H1HWC2_9MICO|nr:glycosyltransferase family 2 protein [Brevibacterium casei]MCT1550823.1 glycosyltransferase family 2 protein [Brevibacterium casei]MCT1559100.1 glycosyltransferase family 2 protein [Brevibacterium casei]MCT2206957.1 glycosyltransferase family 2 protein [Brevibacterium casei]QPR38231.1 glycosyltransferase family 2 protein [Brevibacterium casei]QPR42396.1 glycosyltransferase family 2 protein [Brevibacterium casei]